ncbi:60S ribosomal protein L33B [Friedmanniomyces endolithicus]|nr:60S ribosomal protein L33B [Friedmanniomyces endolithicus]KAK0900427.1 60S ribosomal protein L33B [Friedmanniomyces endolithicus]
MASSTTGTGHRLYVKVHSDPPPSQADHELPKRHLSYQRGKRNTNPDTSLVKIEGVDDPKAATFYLGKKVAYVYRGKREIRGTKIRVLWGKVTRPHGNSGLVRAQFKHNLPPKSFGAMVRIMLYPSSV